MLQAELQVGSGDLSEPTGQILAEENETNAGTAKGLSELKSVPKVGRLFSSSSLFTQKRTKTERLIFFLLRLPPALSSRTFCHDVLCLCCPIGGHSPPATTKHMKQY